MEICKIDACVSCGACVSSCPTQSIELKINALGNLKYSIDEATCVSCGLCKTVCPNNRGDLFQSPMACYAASNPKTCHDGNVASGGVTRALYEKTLEKNGVIVGTAYKDGAFSFIVTESADELSRFSNSKYVRCRVGNAYSQVRDYLDEGREVLFVGLPCQVAGLLGFLRKKYDNLTCVDLVCHGVPPEEYLKEYLSKKENWTDIRFREHGEYVLILEQNGKRIKEEKMGRNSYLLPYIKGIISSDCCYTCRFARPERVSDITLGDFWGYPKEKKKSFVNQRISCVLVHSPKGAEVLSSLGGIQTEICSFDEIAKGNHQLLCPIEKNEQRKKFEKLYEKYGYKGAIFRTGIYRDIVFWILYNKLANIKRLLRRK